MKNDALEQQKRKLNTTKLVIYEDKIVGFASLLSDTILIRNIIDENISADIKKQLDIQTKNLSIPAV